MKKVFRYFLMISIALATACEKEEIIYEPEEEVTTANLSARLTNCLFNPGAVSTVTGDISGFKDGLINEALFNHPSDIVFDENRQIMYVSDWSNNCIRAVKNNKVTTFVGGIEGDREGKGRNARLHTPMGITIDNIGNLYVVDRGNHKIRKITPEGKMTTFAGSTNGYANGRGGDAKFSTPYGITINQKSGILYVTDEANAKIRTITSDASVGTLAGSSIGLRDSGKPFEAQFSYPRGIDMGPDGNLYVADYGNHRIRQVTQTGQTTTFAGGRYGNNNGARSRATFAHPQDVVFDKAGNLFIVDTNNHRIRRIIGNQVSTLTGNRAGDIDGSYNQARFTYPRSIAIFKDDLYVADSFNHSIRKIAMNYDCN